jgi:hypothetical protein
MRMEGNTMDLESIKEKEHKISKTRNNISTAYNDYKEFEGRKYTGMRVGGVHHWYYENGEWKEKKKHQTNGNSLMQLIRKEHGMLQRAQGLQLGQSIIGIFLPIRMSEN